MNVDTWKVQLRKGVLDMVVLNLLKPGSLYGLEMVQRLEKIGGLSISEGTIYPLLSRLREEGLLFAEWVESREGRPRRYYSLSEKGREMVDELNLAWSEFQSGIRCLIAQK